MSATMSSQPIATPFLPRLYASVQHKFQQVLDRSTPHSNIRWCVLALSLFLYSIRVYYLEGFYIVTYGLGIFLLNLFIGFLSPLDEEMLHSDEMGRTNSSILPLTMTSGGAHTSPDDVDEFKPFIRRLPEFQFWYASMKAVCFATFLTMFSMFDVPVYWPILLIYFIILFILTMKRQIKHMLKHRYLPFNLGKKRYTGKIKNTREDIRSR